VFPTSGQANPTLLIAALSARLAAHVARLVRQLPEPERAGGSRRRENLGTGVAVRPSFTGEPHSEPVTMAD
jgi:hypothetical protein